MIRTHVSLREDQARNITLRAKREGKTKAELIWELLDRGWTATYEGEKGETTGKALLRLAAVGKRLNFTGPTDLSSRIDDILYGKNV